MGILEVLLLAFGLSMDAFAVSICKGMATGKGSIRENLICGIWFGAFQAIMPTVGYLAGSRFEKWINYIAPWLAFLLLSVIGINMIREALGPAEEIKDDTDFKTMLMMAIATSIDALAVGITFVAVPVTITSGSRLQNTMIAVIIIGVITFAVSSCGVSIGRIFGERYRSGSEVMGGTILIFLGLRSMIDSLDTMGAMRNPDIVFGMLIPLIGTLIGAFFVYSREKTVSKLLQEILSGAISGIMFSISVWGLLDPAGVGLSDGTISAGVKLFLCFAAGVAIQLIMDALVPHTHVFEDITEGPESKLSIDVKVMLSEIIDHVPEGAALGVIYAGYCLETDWISAPLPLILAIALSVQNFPEALFVSLPLKEKGTAAGRAFLMGVLSGVPTPLLAVITLLVTIIFPVMLPYFMAMAGGAIIYAVIEEIPRMVIGKENDRAAISFVVAFSMVMLVIFL